MKVFLAALVSLCLSLLTQSVAYAEDAWRPVVVRDMPEAAPLQTAVRTDHQGDHLNTECRAIQDGETLTIIFPINPAYHLAIAIDVKDGAFRTDLRWEPISSEAVTNIIETQGITLDKSRYAVGETLKGDLDLTFVTTWVQEGRSERFFVKGPFSAIVRSKTFDRLADDAVKTYTQATALYELGAPVSAYAFRVSNGRAGPATRLEGQPFDEMGFSEDEYRLKKQRAAFLARSQKPKGASIRELTIRELTWDVNPHAPFSDGAERLTLWLRQSGSGEWEQIGHAKWLDQGLNR